MSRSQQPTVEDYHSDDTDREGVVEELRRRSPSAQAQANVEANVAAKRSYPSDMGADKPPAAEKVVNIDLQSDSGYSSHTAATVSSADSGPSAHPQVFSPPTPPESAASAPAANPAERRRPTISRDDRHSSSQNSPRRPLARTGSVSSRRPPRERRTTITTETEDVQDCTDPNCTECVPVPLAVRGRRPKPSQRDSGLDMSVVSMDQRSQRSDPISNSSYAPPSPLYARQPEYRNGQAFVQPAQSTRQRRPSINQAARPLSYAGGEVPQNYWVPGMPVPAGYTPHQEPHGPPPAYLNYGMPMHQSPVPGYPMMGATPPNGFFPPPQMQPQYDLQRPGMPSRDSSTFNARRGRPASQVYTGPPVLTQDLGDKPSARYHNPPSATQPNFSHKQETSSESEDDEEEDEDHLPMPPPPPPPKPKSRPALAQPGTYTSERSSRSNRRQSLMSESVTLEPHRERERDRAKDRTSRLSVDGPSRRTSVSRSRPSLNVVQHAKTESVIEPVRKQVMIENTKSSRRQSYQYDTRHVESDRRSRTYADGGIPLQQGHRRQQTDDAIQRRTGQDRRSRVFEDEEDYPQQNRRRRQTDADIERDEPVGRSKLNEAEAYLQNTRGSKAPLNDYVHTAAMRGSHIPTGRSETGSSRSGKESRISNSNRTTVTNSGNEIRLKVDASAPLSLQFNGDMEGRTLRFEPSEDGMANIVIGDSRGNENTYRSEKGTVVGSSRRTVVSSSARPERARRDHDEESIRTSHSSQARRLRERERDIRDRELRERELERQRDYDDTIQRPLRRKGDLRYH